MTPRLCAEFTQANRTGRGQDTEGRWIKDGNWDHELWGGELPTRDWIDKDTANTPVFVSRLDGHMALANSLVLKLAGIDEKTPDPDGGTIVRDKNGRPTGVLKDNAMNLVVQGDSAAVGSGAGRRAWSVRWNTPSLVA